VFNRELPERYTAKLLYGWGNKRSNREYWRHMEENWRWWKKNLFSRYNKNPFLKKMKEERKEYKKGKIDEDKEDRWRIEEDRKYLEELGDENLNMGNLRDPYNELKKKSSGRGPLRGRWCYKMAGELNDLQWWIILFIFHFLLLCNSLKCMGHYNLKGVRGII